MANCYVHIKNAVSSLFTRYGRLVGRHPIPFIIIPIVVFGGLGMGLLAIEEEKDLEKIYFPVNSRAIQDRQTVRNTFKDLNNISFNAFSQSDKEQAVTLLFVAKSGNIFSTETIREIRKVVNDLKKLKVTVNESVLSYGDVCAVSNSRCVIAGEYVLSPAFQTALAAGDVQYPRWTIGGRDVDLSMTISRVTTTHDSVLSSATVLKISLHLQQDTKLWQNRFLKFAETLHTKFTEVAYESPDSLSVELDRSTKGDILLFSLTITLCCCYASVVTLGGNPVSTRGLLAFGGILAAGLGIVGSMGLLSACGVKFVNIVGVMPFLIIGIGIDDMFLLMSSWSETLGDTEMSVPYRVGATLGTAAIGITITSLTDFLAFAIGTTSVFRSVTNFSLYAGFAVLFCYLAHLTFFTGCLALHGRRVYASRHFLTCCVTVPRQVQRGNGEGPSLCSRMCCQGSPPEEERADESRCEKWPRVVLPKIFTKKPVSGIIVMVFLGYVAVAMYGACHLPQGLKLQNLVQETSYLHRYLELNQEYFPSRLPVGLIVDGAVDYSGSEGQLFLSLLDKVRQDPQVVSGFQRCWLTSYMNSTFYSSSSPERFVSNLGKFLASTPDFLPDVVVNEAQGEVTASRCFVISEPISEQYAMAELMVRLRELMDTSSLPVFAYHSSFVAFEQFVAILPATLIMVGCAVVVMTLITFLFLPHPRMVALVFFTILMILTGIFGFLYYWNLTLSSITMIHLVMSVGFSVDFSAHVCAAYLMSDCPTREERAGSAIRHAAGPILNGATSTLIGVILLVASSSYIFLTFFKIMVLVIVLGLLHAVFFLPAVLCLIGPQGVTTNSPQPATSEDVDLNGTLLIASGHGEGATAHRIETSPAEGEKINNIAEINRKEGGHVTI